MLNAATGEAKGLGRQRSNCGAVITDAGTDSSVNGLVYMTAFAPDRAFVSSKHSYNKYHQTPTSLLHNLTSSHPPPNEMLAMRQFAASRTP